MIQMLSAVTQLFKGSYFSAGVSCFNTILT